MYEEVKTKLETHQKFRERKMRDYYLSILAVRKIKVLIGEASEDTIFQVPMKKMAEFGRAYASYERNWRAVMDNTPTLRGLDYEDKSVLEQEKQIELGYEIKEMTSEQIDKLMETM